MDVKKKKALVAASVAGLLAVAPVFIAGTAHAQAAPAAKVPCYGINACKGTGECAGKGHSCSGKNACKGMGMTNVASADECLKAGGTLEAPKE